MNQEEQIRELLEKFERQACSEAELRQLHAWLEERASSGKPWEFSGSVERAEMRARILGPVAAAMGAMDKTAPEGRQVHGLREGMAEKSRGAGGQGTAGRQGLLVRSLGAGGKGAVIRPWLKYTAAAAAVALLVWGTIWQISPSRTILASTAAGEIRRITLPDGSTAWLNGRTEIAYHGDFATSRTLELKRGELFVDVKKDPRHLFQVRSGSLSTTVLGTSFSARMSGAGEQVKISVVTGKVMVSRAKDTLGLLTAGRRLKYDSRMNHATLDSAQTDEADGWIRGDIFLQNASLQEVIQWLQDKFNVHVENKRVAYAGDYYLQAKNDITLPEVLKILNLLGKKDQVHFSLQGQTITIQ